MRMGSSVLEYLLGLKHQSRKGENEPIESSDDLRVKSGQEADPSNSSNPQPLYNTTIALAPHGLKENPD
jgi:hypothetical protein